VKTSQPKRVLISEGSSLSARQTITALGVAGHQVGVCDSNSFCLGRFSRFVTHFYQSPALGDKPWEYLDFIVEIAREGRWDVLFPTHEQAFLFSRERKRFPPAIALALADFQSFLQIQGKAAQVKTFSRLSIPQPPSIIIRTHEELEKEFRYPLYLKGDYGTASKAVWRIRNVEELRSKITELRSQNRLGGGEEFVVQQAAQGALERVLAVFNHSALVAIHGYRQVLEGLGGGDTAKLSINRSAARRYVELLGRELRWHGALSLDYIFQEDGQTPLFIDANPRLVEPMNAVLSGVNLADILVRISAGELNTTEMAPGGEVRTHIFLMAILSAAAKRQKRFDILREILRAFARRGLYASSREELLPVQIDFKCLVPLVYALIRLLVKPGAAHSLSTGAIASYSFSPAAARQIADWNNGGFSK
jgi:predicted ATP-grasp superfamily ATP-dependent carboligase